jgi:hypothetical protein
MALLYFKDNLFVNIIYCKNIISVNLINDKVSIHKAISYFDEAVTTH